jgi:Ca2+-binding EF-hand superfamily protein
MFISMSENLSPEAIAAIFKQFDQDGNGMVDIE